MAGATDTVAVTAMAGGMAKDTAGATDTAAVTAMAGGMDTVTGRTAKSTAAADTVSALPNPTAMSRLPIPSRSRRLSPIRGKNAVARKW